MQVLDALGLVDDLVITDGLGNGLPVGDLRLLRRERLHDQSLLLGGAYVDAVVAARTVERRYLNAELVGLGLAQSLLPLDARSCGLLLGGEERTYGGVGADIRTLVALDTVFDLPLGNVDGDAALLVGCRAVVPRTVLTAVECRHWQAVALQRIDRLAYLAHECRNMAVDLMRSLAHLDRRPLRGHFDTLDGVATGIDGGVVHIDYVLALLAV